MHRISVSEEPAAKGNNQKGIPMRPSPRKTTCRPIPLHYEIVWEPKHLWNLSFLALKALSTNLGTMVDPQEMQVESLQEQVPNDKALDGQE